MKKRRSLYRLRRFLLRFLFFRVCFVGFPKRFQFYDPRLIPDSPRDDLPSMFPIIGLDDRPAAVRAVVTTPFEMVQIPRGMDLFDDRITVTCIMR